MVSHRLRSLVSPVILLFLLGAGPLAAGPGPTFRVALGADPGTLDWPLLDDKRVLPLRLALAGSLVDFNPVNGLPRPGLAESWTTSDDRRTWTFTLRASVWSDGTPLTAQDAADAWDRTGRAGAPDPLNLGYISAEAPDARHLKVTFRNPVPSAAVFTGPRFAVSPADPADPRGCGPFVPILRKPAQFLSAVKNPQYWDAASVRFSKVVFVFTDGPGTAELLYRKGEVDWVPHSGGPGTSVEPGLRDAVVSPGWGTTFLRFNLTLNPGDTRDLRRLLSEILDRNRLAAVTRGPLAVPGLTLVPPASAPQGDPVRAKAAPVIDQAEITILHPAGETNRRLAQEVADQWTEKLGLVVGLKEVSFDQYRDIRKRGLYQVALAGWLGDYPDPLTFLDTFRSDSPVNDTGWADPKYDALVARLGALPYGRSRDQTAAEAEARLLADQPLVPLVFQASVNQISLKRWQGWYPNPSDAHPWTGFGPRR